MDLHIFWFIMLGLLLAGYGVLDGFDLGVGILHLFARSDIERRIFMNSIGPLWDGNEVWLVTFGGALFAAFPHVYATALSGFYLPFMFILFCLLFRAVSMEFRSKHEAKLWRDFFDFCFFSSSVLATFLFGVAIGNTLKGIPIGIDKDFHGTLGEFFHPYPILIGLLAIATCAMHGSIYLYLKTEMKLQERIHAWMWCSFGIFLTFYMLATIYTLVHVPYASDNFQKYPLCWIVVILNVLAIANIPRAIYLNRPVYAFASSCATIFALTFLYGSALFPNLLVSTLSPAHNLTIYNASSSDTTLVIMAIIAALGMPFVLSYTGIVYWIFRGKVDIGKFTY